MNDEEKRINRTIHEFLGECWHEAKPEPLTNVLRCKKCKKTFVDGHSGTDYTASLDHVRVAELKVVEVYGKEEYASALENGFGELEIDVMGGDGYILCAHYALADAKARAEAIEWLIEKNYDPHN